MLPSKRTTTYESHEISFHKLSPIFLVTRKCSSFSSVSLHISTQSIDIMWNRKCIIKVRVKKQICWLRGKNFFRSEECQRFFPRPFNIEQLVIFLSNDTSLSHQCPTYFLSLCGLKIILFISAKFSAHHTECTGLPTGLLIHEMKSSYIILILFSFVHFAYEIKSTSNEKWHKVWLKRWT